MKRVLQEKPVTTNHDVLGKIEFPVEVMEMETQEEILTDTGGVEGLLRFHNGNRATNAKNAARAYARNYEVPKDVELTEAKIAELKAEIEAVGQKLALDYTPQAEEKGPSKAAKARAADEIAALLESGQEFSRETLAAILAKVK